jgi:photosystem II stability/assembly factor-like uncharacterized protein
MKVLHENREYLVASPTSLAPSEDAEALFKEARQRRRRRRALMASGIVIVLAIAALAVITTRNRPGGPPGVPGQAVGGSRTLRVNPSPGSPGTSGASVYTPVQVMGLADDSIGWAADGTGIYVTTDQGRSWGTVTPPNLANEDVSERIGAMDAVGQSDLWLVLEDVPGLVPYSQSKDGSDRGEGIDRSTDGGQTWTFSALPGCLQECGANLSVSFVDAEHGFASIGLERSMRLFSTDDGGAIWTPVGGLPNLGGPTPGSQIVFTSTLDGWAISGPTFGGHGQVTYPGGVLYRTTDSGVSWSRAPGLPSKDQFALPTFFGSKTGVVLSNPEGSPKQSTSIFVTHDGGRTWTAHPLPTIAKLASLKPKGLGSRFAAFGPTSWRIDTGSALYSTSDAGRIWTWFVPIPASANGTVSSVVFSSSRDGMAISLPPGCSGPDYDPHGPPCFPSLTVSTDGGSEWEPVQP